MSNNNNPELQRAEKTVTAAEAAVSGSSAAMERSIR